MKKALEAGIKHCSLFEKYLTHLPEMVDFYYKQKIILQVMLAALDDEPEKSETQGSVVDWEALEKIFRKWYPSTGDDFLEHLKKIHSQWLHTKPVQEPQGSVVDYQRLLYLTIDRSPIGIKYHEHPEMMLEHLKENEKQWLKPKPTIDPEIKGVYDHWKKNDGIVVIERAFERDMWEAIKAHCEGK